MFFLTFIILKNWQQIIRHFHDFYLAHVIEKRNLRIPNPQYFLLFKWKFDDFFIHFEFDRGDKKTKCIHKSNVIKKIVVNIGDSEFVNFVFRWREQDILHQSTKQPMFSPIFSTNFSQLKMITRFLLVQRYRKLWPFQELLQPLKILDIPASRTDFANLLVITYLWKKKKCWKKWTKTENMTQKQRCHWNKNLKQHWGLPMWPFVTNCTCIILPIMSKIPQTIFSCQKCEYDQTGRSKVIYCRVLTIKPLEIK